MAVQLLSNTTASAIEELFPSGEADGIKNFLELANFIRLADRRVTKISNPSKKVLCNKKKYCANLIQFYSNKSNVVMSSL